MSNKYQIVELTHIDQHAKISKSHSYDVNIRNVTLLRYND